MDAINRNVELTETERVDRLRLIRSDNVGPRGAMSRTQQKPDHGRERFSTTYSFENRYP
nr:hypothetical protein [Bradyrhizobium sp. WSM3983]